MAGFNDLPNEIILGVWPHVLAPEDIASFALVSKRVFELGTSFLEEDHRLRSKYTIAQNNRAQDLTHLLKDVLSNPHIAIYVRQLLVSDWGTHEDPILASLLDLLPGLCTLNLGDPPSGTEIFAAVHRIAKKATLESFPKLKNIYLSDISLHENEGLPLMRLFLLLPSVEKISCCGFFKGHRELGIPNCLIAPRSSIITELVFDSCGDITQGLSMLLEKIKALRKFTYVLNLNIVEAASVQSILLQHCRNSLEYLKLVSFENNDETTCFKGTLDSLQSFENLKELDVDFSLLVNSGAGGKFEISDSLPASIEAINILRNPTEADQHSVFIRTLVKAKRTGLLDLKRLSHRVFSIPGVVYTDLCQQCGWHNIVEEPKCLDDNNSRSFRELPPRLFRVPSDQATAWLKPHPS